MKGRVLDPQGRPVPSATILAHPVGEPLPIVGETKGLEDGSFALSGLSASSDLVLEAGAPGWLGSSPVVVAFDPGEIEEGVILKLREGAKMEGQVLSGSDNTPIEGVSVRFHTLESSLGFSREGLFQETDEAGAFQFQGLPPGEGLVLVTARGFASEARRVVLKGTDRTRVSLALATELLLVGSLRAESGRALAGLNVVAGPAGALDKRLGDSTLSAEDGSFTLHGLGPGENVLVVSTEEAVLHRERIRLPASEPLILTILPPATLHGVVTAEDGSAGPKAFRLRLDSLDPSMEYRLSRAFEGDRFRIEGLPHGSYSIWVRSQDGREGTVDAVSLSDASEEVRVPLLSGGSLTGRIALRTTGAPVAYAEVTITGATPQPSGMLPRWTARADERGRFLVRGLPTDSLRFAANRKGFGHLRLLDRIFLEEGGSRDLGTLFLEEPGAIEGVLIGSSGQPVAGARIVPEYHPVGGGTEERWRVSTGQDGSFRLEDLPAGRFLLFPKGLCAHGFGVLVSPGETSHVTLDLSDEGLVVRGTLLDAKGQAVPGASLWTAEVDARGESGEVISDALGRFEMSGLFPGDWVMHVLAPGSASSTSILTHMEGPGPVALKLRIPSGAIAGRVAMTAEEPWSVHLVREDLSGDAAWYRRARWRFHAQSTDASGGFRFENLPSGRYAVFAAPARRAQRLRNRELWDQAVAESQALRVGPFELGEADAIEGLVLGR